MGRKSIDIRFIMPQDMDVEDLARALDTGLVSINFTNLEGKIFNVEIEEALIRDRLIILKEKL